MSNFKVDKFKNDFKKSFFDVCTTYQLVNISSSQNKLAGS